MFTEQQVSGRGGDVRCEGGVQGAGDLPRRPSDAAVDAETTDTPAPTRRAAAMEACADSSSKIPGQHAELGDDDMSLTLNGAGEDSDGLPVDDIACVLVGIDVPDHVLSQMDRTRALDGMRDVTWDGIDATWTYHPDDGLDVILVDNGS